MRTKVAMKFAQCAVLLTVAIAKKLTIRSAGKARDTGDCHFTFHFKFGSTILDASLESNLLSVHLGSLTWG